MIARFIAIVICYPFSKSTLSEHIFMSEIEDSNNGAK